MNLLIDDAKEGTGYDIVARNSDAGLYILQYLTITELYIDFDLGLNSDNGNDVIKSALKLNSLPNKVIIVSLNHPGRKQIEGTLLDNGFKKIGTSRFERI